jgi:hypothetical protein
MGVQTVLVPRDIGSDLKTITAWLLAHGYVVKKVDITDNYYRFRQFNPRPADIYRSTKLRTSLGHKKVIVVEAFPRG